MSRVRRRTARGRRELPLNLAERLDLTQGADRAQWGAGIRWRNEAERRDAWLAHRDELMAAEHRPAVRPLAWWQYETDRMPDWPGAPELFDPRRRLAGPDRGPAWNAYLLAMRDAVRYLAANGHLAPEEIAALRSRVTDAESPTAWEEAAMLGLEDGLAAPIAGA